MMFLRLSEMEIGNPCMEVRGFFLRGMSSKRTIGTKGTIGKLGLGEFYTLGVELK